MDQNKKAETQPTQGHQGQQRMDRDRNWSGQAPDKDRDPAEGSRDQAGGGASDMGSQERGAGAEGERNRRSSGSHESSGISNRGMSSHDEQEDLPARGSTGQGSPDQSER
jgi:hypothetical protein